MHVDFGGGDVFVPKHHLYGTQIGPSLQQVGGKTVTESVGADILADACLLGITFDIYKQTYPAQPASTGE